MPEKLPPTKEQRIRKEFLKIKKIINSLDASAVKLLSPLMQNAAFMSVTLDDLIAGINENGCVSEYKNGENQYGTKKSPEIEVYNTMIKNYKDIIRQLFDFRPDGAGDSDELGKYMIDKMMRRSNE